MSSYGSGHGRENLDEPADDPELEARTVGARIMRLARLKRWTMGESTTQDDEVPW